MASKKSPKITAKAPSHNLAYTIVLICIPFLLIILLEVSLRMFNYGFDNRQWIEIGNDKLTLNPEIARRYFSSLERLPESIHDVFDRNKKANAFRVFILGESSAAGFPYMPAGSFSRYLQKRLELVYPDTKIEVINTGMTAISSYTLLDIFPGILEQKPDLVIIYTGHNEYYGALGAGSMESGTSGRTLIKASLFFNRFKIYWLLKDALKYAAGLFSSNPPDNGTLMSRMAKEQSIIYGSDTYKLGIEQFRNNLSEMLSLAKEKNVPVILSTLISNLKDQHPFISKNMGTLPSAENIFSKAKMSLSEHNTAEAESLFSYSRDLDLLRFRAPGEINTSIISLGKEFNNPVVKMDSVFNAESPDGIAGDNLICDHLHPNLRGYKIMGRVFYEEMSRRGLLPVTKEKYMDPGIQDSITCAEFSFSRLDSVSADYGIRILKNDFPFTDLKNKKSFSSIILPADYIDSLAAALVQNRIQWEEAQRKAASWYLRKNRNNEFRQQMNVLISQFPYLPEYFDLTAEGLIKLKQYDDACYYLQKRFTAEPNAFSAKWLGIISVKQKKYDEAIFYLNKCLDMQANDAQVLYNLAAAFMYEQKFNQAYDVVKRCLSINSRYPGALKLYKICDQVVHSKKPVVVKFE